VRDETRLGLFALGAAAVLGLLGDLLLRASPWGLNAPLWIALLLAAAGLLLWQAKLPLFAGSRWLAIVALVFAAGIALRDSPVMIAVNILATLLTLGLAGHRAKIGWPRIGGLPEYVSALLSAGFHAIGGIIVLSLYDIRWREVPRTGWASYVLSILRGLLIAIPLLLLFGALFMAADAVFSGLVSNLFRINIRDAFGHVFWVGVWAWLTAGFLRQVLLCTIAETKETPTALTPTPSPSRGEGRSPQTPDLPGPDDRGFPLARVRERGAGGEGSLSEERTAATPAPAEPKLAAPVTPEPRRPGGRIGVLGIVELGVVLGLLDVLFLAFVVVQFRYLFGGAALVQVSDTLTYAEYARRGFFELVWVAALLLPMMLFLDWLARLDSPRQVRIYRTLAGLLVALLFVVIVSALQRMRLYTQEYGLTELRLYTTAFMFWITAGAVWYLATVLRDQRERFLFGAMIAGLVAAAILNALDPDNLIVRTNSARADASTRFDGDYPLLLSLDAAPATVDALPLMPRPQRISAARQLLRRWEAAQDYDWRSWNYGRWRAWEAIAAHEPMLREAAKPGPPRPRQASACRQSAGTPAQIGIGIGTGG